MPMVPNSGLLSIYKHTGTYTQCISVVHDNHINIRLVGHIITIGKFT